MFLWDLVWTFLFGGENSGDDEGDGRAEIDPDG